MPTEPFPGKASTKLGAKAPGAQCYSVWLFCLSMIKVKPVTKHADYPFKRMREWIEKEKVAAWIYLLPSILLFSVFWFYPTVMLLFDSFFEWDGLSERIFLGLQNYRELLGDAEFHMTLKNTFVFIFGTVPTGMAIGLILALLLQKHIFGRGILRTIFFSPVVTSLVAAGLTWVWLLNYDYGIVNQILIRLGFDKVPWLVSEQHAMLSVILMTIWKDAGYNMVLFLGGLNSISRTYYEAASIDGANSWQMFWTITWPLLMPTTFFVLVTRVIFTFRTFEQIYAMTRGGPAGATTVFVYYVYEKAFQNFELGYASAAAMILLIIVLIVTAVQFKLVKYKW
jgi:multiple sugar transport system permease protein